MTDTKTDPITALAKTIVDAIEQVSKTSAESDRAIFGLVEMMTAEIVELTGRVRKLEKILEFMQYEPGEEKEQ